MERRLHRKVTTRRRKRDTHGDGTYIGIEQIREGDYTERGVHKDGTT